MDKIRSILDGLDNIGKLVPELGKLLGGAPLWIMILLLIGPAVMVLLGVIYLFLPPKEANHHIGYRTYFGMGSVEAWLHTQKIAGIIYGGVGILLGVVMAILGAKLRQKELVDAYTSAIIYLCVQVGIVVLIYLGLFVYTMIVFDRHGNRRKDKRK